MELIDIALSKGEATVSFCGSDPDIKYGTRTRSGIIVAPCFWEGAAETPVSELNLTEDERACIDAYTNLIRAGIALTGVYV